VKDEIVAALGTFGIVPVLVFERADVAVPVCRALAAGGLPLAEITFRTDAAAEAIGRVSAELPEVLLGAGTVLTQEQAGQAIDSGARFVVSPGVSPAVVRYCIERDVAVLPGCATATDVSTALDLGVQTVKFFPAEALGGVKTLKALAGPFRGVKFVPTGGIDPGNLNEYLALPQVLACGGSWLATPEAMRAGDYEAIEKGAAQAVSVMLGFELAHLGINRASAEEALELAGTLGRLWHLPVKEGSSSVFSGPAFEVMKGDGRGARGHVAIRTNSIPRAVAHLERLGIAVDPDSAKGPAGGPITAIYLRDEIAGFAFHLLQK